MSIRFTDKDWDRIERDWSLFWEGELKRPIVYIECMDPLSHPVKEAHVFIPQYPKEMDAEEIIEIENRVLESKYFIGDTYPKFFLNFGAGSAAAYFGSELKADENTVWFESTSKNLEEIEICLDKENYWYKRVHAVLDAALKKLSGVVQVGPSDIGGNLDIIASLRGTNELLLDVCDSQDIVKSLTDKLTSVWIELFKEEEEKIKSVCYGTTCRGGAPMWSKNTTNMLQCDFCSMISPDMFERFVLPDLTICCDVIDDPFYHLDGKGQLPHLDMILSIPKLKGVQWIPGAGQPPVVEWLDVLKKIRDAGKLCQVGVSPESALKIKNELGGDGFLFWCVSHSEVAQDIYNELAK